MKWIVCVLLGLLSGFSSLSVANDSQLKHAFESRQSDIQINGTGKVIRVLADDNKGSKHQKFILKLANGQTLLVAHNIDLAPRISNIQVGDNIKFYGEYEWSRQGGVLHWTHRDPAGRHIGGWLKHKGKTYN